MSAHHKHQVDVDAILREHGAHCTAPRRAVWGFFSGDPQGHAIGEAVSALKGRGIGAATVYRTVELFIKIGLLTSTRDEAGKVRYMAICPGHRHALVCRGCHAVVEFSDCDLSMLEKLLSAQTGYSIQGHHLEIYGMCPECVTRS